MTRYKYNRTQTNRAIGQFVQRAQTAIPLSYRYPIQSNQIYFIFKKK